MAPSSIGIRGRAEAVLSKALLSAGPRVCLRALAERLSAAGGEIGINWKEADVEDAGAAGAGAGADAGADADADEDDDDEDDDEEEDWEEEEEEEEEDWEEDEEEEESKIKLGSSAETCLCAALFKGLFCGLIRGVFDRERRRELGVSRRVSTLRVEGGDEPLLCLRWRSSWASVALRDTALGLRNTTLALISL